jgi:hypothetical protein
MEEVGLGVALVLILGITFGFVVTEVVWRTDMIERGYAEYCPKDGNFAFLGECDK